MSSDFNKDALLRSAKRINVSYFKEQQEDAINAIWQWWQSQSISFTLRKICIYNISISFSNIKITTKLLTNQFNFNHTKKVLKCIYKQHQ